MKITDKRPDGDGSVLLYHICPSTCFLFEGRPYLFADPDVVVCLTTGRRCSFNSDTWMVLPVEVELAIVRNLEAGKEE